MIVNERSHEDMTLKWERKNETISKDELLNFFINKMKTLKAKSDEKLSFDCLKIFRKHFLQTFNV